MHVPSSISHTPDPDSLQHLSILPTFRPHKAPVKLHKLELGQRVFTASGPAFAEYMVAPWSKVAPMPEGVDPRDGVSMASIAITALTLIKEAGVMRKGEWCLVRAAAGGVGAILVQVKDSERDRRDRAEPQLAKYVGANLIATVSSEAKAQLVKSLGAEHVLLTSTPSEENVKTILGLTNGKGVHVVYDGVGADTWEEDFLIVRPKGTIVTFGNASVRRFPSLHLTPHAQGPVPPFPALKLSPKSLTVVRPTMGPYISTPEEFAWYADEVFQAVQDGALKVSPVETVGERSRAEKVSSSRTKSTRSRRRECSRRRLISRREGRRASC